MKKIVVKMRSFKKLFGGDLLQLALLLSLLKVDPDNYLGYNPHSSTDPGGDIISGPAMLQDSWRHDDLSPRIHPKSMDSLLDIHQAEILEDLNSLGRYSRLSHYGGLPVHISAYILDTEHGASPPPGSSCQENDGAESDSGISDTNHDSDQESTSEHDDTEKEKDLEVDMECETILTQLAAPSEVLGLEAIVGLTPPPETEGEEMMAYTAGQDALEAELVHIDEQLMTIEDDLGHIDEQFIMMDQQLAETISDESMYEREVFNNMASAATEVDLDTIDIVGNNPFDDWQREALSELNDLVLDTEVQHEAISSLPDPGSRLESQAGGRVENPEERKEEEILSDPTDLFPTDQTLLEDFDEDLLESKFIRTDLDKIVKQDVVLPQMSSLQQNSSHPYRSVAPTSLLDHQSFPEQSASGSSKESSVDRDLMEEINVDVMDQDDEDIIMQVLRESNINFDEIPIDIDGLKVEQEEEEIKLEDIKEEVVEVEDIGYQISIVDGAAAKAEIDYDQLHSDIKAKFQESDDGYSFAELTLGSQFSEAYNPGFNSRAFENDHSYGVATKLEPRGLLEAPETSRRRNVSESSGYSSMTEDQAGSSSSSRCRDEIKAKKMKLPFLVADIINSPVDLFNEMLLRPGLSSEQLQLCKDIRRRGKNKVAAQNCRKRKMDTIEELQHQVDQVRRRREQLLRAREELEAERARWSSKLSYLEENVLHGIGKELGMFTLEVRDNTVVVTSTTNLLAAGGAEKSPGGRSQN